MMSENRGASIFSTLSNIRTIDIKLHGFRAHRLNQD